MSKEMSLLCYASRLTVAEAALVIGIPLRTLQRKVKDKAVPSFKSLGITYILLENVLSECKTHKNI